MLQILRTRFIKVCARSSVAIAIAFGFNATAFVLWQNELGSAIARDEARIAFQESFFQESAYVDEIIESFERCQNGELLSCKDLAQNIVLRNSRLNDIKIFFQNTPPVNNEAKNEIIRDLDLTIFAINTIAKKGFRLSLEKAYSLGITNAKEYSEYVYDSSANNLSIFMIEGKINKEIEQIRSNVELMKAWIQREESVEIDAERSMQNAQISFAFLVVLEVLLYLMVSSSDFWLTNIPMKYRVKSKIAFIKTRSAIPMAGVVLVGLATLIISQLILYTELERTVLEGCRKINRNSIFTVNQMTNLYERNNSWGEQSTAFPIYCERIIKTERTQTSIHKTQKDGSQRVLSREQVINYAEDLSEIQAKKSDFSGRLALMLLSLNTLSMTLNAIKLDFQNTDVDDE